MRLSKAAQPSCFLLRLHANELNIASENVDISAQKGIIMNAFSGIPRYNGCLDERDGAVVAAIDQ